MTGADIVVASMGLLREPYILAGSLFLIAMQPEVMRTLWGLIRRSRSTRPKAITAYLIPARGLGPVVSTKASAATVVLVMIGAIILLSASAGWPGLMTIGLGCVLGTLALLDCRFYWLPDRMTLPLLAVGLLASADVRMALLGVVFWGGAPWLIGWLYGHWRGHSGLGAGDVKLMAAMGAWLELSASALAITCACLVTIAYAAIVASVLKRDVSTLRLPLGAFLAMSFWCTWLAMIPAAL
jgi:leader peptidase (prepilin peptidase) / N-methyltransferase